MEKVSVISLRMFPTDQILDFEFISDQIFENALIRHSCLIHPPLVLLSKGNIEILCCYVDVNPN